MFLCPACGATELADCRCVTPPITVHRAWWRDATPTAVFGGLDGVSTAINAIAGSPHLAAKLAVSLAAGGATSMSLEEVASEATTTRAQAAAMFIGFFAGMLAPAAPTLAGAPNAFPIGVGIGTAAAVIAGLLRAGRGRARQIAITVGCYAVVVAVSYGAATIA